MTETIANIINDEGGNRADIYVDSFGNRTWLIGRNIDSRPITTREWKQLGWITDHGEIGIKPLNKWARWMFDAEIRRLHVELSGAGVKFLYHSDSIEAIVLNMAFNMGTTRFNSRNWPKFFAALGIHNYKEMATQIKYADVEGGRLTKWWRQVDNHSDNFIGRAERLYLALIEESER